MRIRHDLFGLTGRVSISDATPEFRQVVDVARRGFTFPDKVGRLRFRQRTCVFVGRLRNVHLGERDRLDPRAIRAEVAEIAQQYGLDVDVDARVRDLTAGQRQRVEIVKCLRRNPSLMILDEPTSVLTLAESEALFDVLRRVVGAIDELPVAEQRDIMRSVLVDEVMVRGIATVDVDTDIREVAELMLDNKFGCVPVVEGDRLVGILTEADFVKFVISEAEELAPS